MAMTWPADKFEIAAELRRRGKTSAEIDYELRTRFSFRKTVDAIGDKLRRGNVYAVVRGVSWSDSEDAIIKRMWPTGSSASDISRAIRAELKITRSRNACIARVHRLGMAKRSPEALALPPRPKKPRRMKSKEPKPIVRPGPTFEDLPPPVEPLNVPFLENGPFQCHAITDATRFAQRCCGHPVTGDSKYCQAHVEMHRTPSRAKHNPDSMAKLVRWIDGRGAIYMAGRTL